MQADPVPLRGGRCDRVRFPVFAFWQATSRPMLARATCLQHSAPSNNFPQVDSRLPPSLGEEGSSFSASRQLRALIGNSYNVCIDRKTSRSRYGKMNGFSPPQHTLSVANTLTPPPDRATRPSRFTGRPLPFGSYLHISRLVHVSCVYLLHDICAPTNSSLGLVLEGLFR